MKYNIEPLGIGLRKPKDMNIHELFEAGTKKGLKGYEVPCPHCNPQRLCMDELQKRIYASQSSCDYLRGEQWLRD